MRRLAGALIGVSLVLPGPLAAQFGLAQPASELRIVAQIDIPAYVDPFYDAIHVGAAALIPLRENVTVLTGGSLIYSTTAGRSGSLVVSNAHASVQLGRDGGFATIALSIPTTGRYTDERYATEAGLLLDLERPESFTPDAVSFGVYLTPRRRFASGGLVGLSVGFAAVTPAGLARKFYARYALFGDRALGRVRIGAEVSGAYLAAAERANLGLRTIHHARVHAQLPQLPLEPMVYLRLPLDDDASRATDLVAGLRVTF